MTQRFINHTILQFKPVIPNGFAIGTPQNSGHLKVRRKWNTLLNAYDVEVLMDHTQFSSFLSWYRDNPGEAFEHMNEMNNTLEKFRIVPGTIKTNWIDKSRQHLRVSMMWQQVI